VRARTLSSLISPFFCIVGCFGLGFVLDMKSLSQRRRAQIGLLMVVLLNLGVYIWSIVMQAAFDSHSPGKIDWDDALYARSFLPYFFVQTTGPLSQSYMYWLLSSFATDAQGERHSAGCLSETMLIIYRVANVRNGAAFRCLEAIGQAISYGMNTQIKTSPMIGFCVTSGLMAIAFGPMLVLVNSTPERIPADVTAEEIQCADSKFGVVNIDTKA